MTQKLRFLMIISALSATPALPHGAWAVDDKNVVSAEPQVRKLLQMMDTDANGKVSKQEFMNFMEAEFKKLDVNMDGELDVEELGHLRYSSKHPGGSGSR